MSGPAPFDPHAAVAAEFNRLADILEPGGDDVWDTRSLCEGWRVRHVVAHMTQAARYTPDAFLAELEDCGGDFGVLSNRIAERDGALPTGTLLANLRDERMHRWEPPRGGVMGALSHVTIHGLDITHPLGIPRPPDDTLVAVLDHLAKGGGHHSFGVDVSGTQLRASDHDWSFGSGTPFDATTAELILPLANRRQSRH